MKNIIENVSSNIKLVSTDIGETIVVKKNTEISELLEVIQDLDWQGECLYLTSDLVIEFSEGKVGNNEI